MYVHWRACQAGQCTVPPSDGLSHAWFTGLEDTGAPSQGSVPELAHGAQGLDASEAEGGAVQGLPITGLLEWTAVKTNRQKRGNPAWSIKNTNSQTVRRNNGMVGLASYWPGVCVDVLVCLRWATHLQSPRGQRGCHKRAELSSKGH